MPLDPEARVLLDQLAARGFRAVHEIPVDEARRARDRIALEAERPPVARVEERSISRPGGRLPVRVYRGTAEGPLPVLVYLHGGGWVVGSLETHDVLCRWLANATPCTVVSVGYRLAPEHPYPAALEDAYAAASWAAGQFGVPIAIGGDSAGANLAAAAAMLARDCGGPPIAFQLLLYPVASDDFGTPSYLEYADGPFLTREGMRWYFEQYVPAPGDRLDPLVALLKADDLSDLPPALVLTAECDVLRDEGEAYAAKLRAAGVDAVGIRYQGMFHAFMSYPNELAGARHALQTAGASLRRALGAVGGGP